MQHNSIQTYLTWLWSSERHHPPVCRTYTEYTFLCHRCSRLSWRIRWNEIYPPPRSDSFETLPKFLVSTRSRCLSSSRTLWLPVPCNAPSSGRLALQWRRGCGAVHAGGVSSRSCCPYYLSDDSKVEIEPLRQDIHSKGIFSHLYAVIKINCPDVFFIPID